jgi:hypothetical protein
VPESPGSLARALLGSGVFLERQTLLAFQEQGFAAQGPYEYARRNDDDEDSFESVDVLATLDDEIHGAILEVHVAAECKYSSPQGNPAWFFLDALQNRLTRHSMVCQGVDIKQSVLRRSLLEWPTPDAVGPGTFVYQNDRGYWNANENQLSNALRQAYLPILQHAIERGTGAVASGDPLIALYIPAVITNADIYRLAQMVRPEDVEGMQSHADIVNAATKHSLVRHVFRPPMFAREFGRKLISKASAALPDEVDPEEALKGIRDVRVGLGWNLPKQALIGSPETVAKGAKAIGGKWMAEMKRLLSHTKKLPIG